MVSVFEENQGQYRRGVFGGLKPRVGPELIGSSPKALFEVGRKRHRGRLYAGVPCDVQQIRGSGEHDPRVLP